MSAAATRPAAFDPNQVPIYPVLTIELADTGPTLNGRAVPVPEGVSPEQAAVAAAAREVHTMPGVHAVRVNARTATGTGYRIVIDADGQVWELPEPDQARRRPPWLRPVVVACAAVVLCGTAAAALSGRTPPRTSRPPAVPAPATVGGPVGAGANLPRTPPPGYAARAVWSVALDARTDPLVTTAGTIIAVAEHDKLVRLDPATGNITWTGRLPSGINSPTLHLSSVAGVPVLATTQGQKLYTWRLPAPDQPASAGQTPDVPQAIGLPREGVVSFDGTSPLVTLPDQTAAVLTSSGTQQLDLPIGATALTADGTAVLAADSTGRWWHLTPGQQATAPLSMSPPAGAAAAPLRVLPVGSAHLAGIWATAGGQTVVLYDAATGQPTAQAAVTDLDLTHAAVIRQTDSPRLTLGPVLIDPTTPAVIPLAAGIAPSAVTAGHVYATANRQWLDITTTTTGGAAPARQIATDDPPALPRGIVAGPPSQALVVADKVDHRLLYALGPG